MTTVSDTKDVSTMTVATAAIWDGIESGFTVTSQSLPELRSGEVLVAIELATICGSDLHTIAGDRATPLPTVLGHEAVGYIVEVGGESLGREGQSLVVGDRVTWTIGTACGACRRCRRAIPQKCESVRKYGHEAIDDHWRLNGGFASHCHLVQGTGLVSVPDDLPANVAAPANCATATVTCAARRVELSAEDVVVVLGCGMLGLTAVAYAKDQGVDTVIAVDVDPSRRDLAKEFGATVVVAPEDLAATTEELGADVIFELSGNSRAVQSAFDNVALGGRIAMVGSVSPAPEISFEPSGFVKNLTMVVGSHNYRVDDLVEAIAFLSRTPALHLFADLVPEPFDLKDIDDAVAVARTAVAPRIAVRP